MSFSSGSANLEEEPGGQEVTFTTLDLKAMSESEYSQPFPYRQLEGAAPALYPGGGSSRVSQFRFAKHTSQSGFPYSGCQNVHPGAYPPVPDDVLSCQEIGRMVPSVPQTTGRPGSSGAGTARMTAGANVKSKNSSQASHSNCIIDVCSEDRFNRSQSEGVGGPEEQGSSCNSAAILLSPPPCVRAQPHHNRATLGMGDTSEGTGKLHFPCLAIGPPGSSHTQASASCAAKRRGSFRRIVSQCRQKGSKKGRGGSATYNPAPEELQDEAKDAPWEPLMKRRHRNPQGQGGGDTEHRMSLAIQNSGEDRANKEILGASWSPAQRRSSASRPSYWSATRRRENHNRSERDRRNRIRMYCDELKLFAPFCHVGTDKATTLKWSVSFLKYIQEQHGDSLKKAFESSYSKATKTDYKGDQSGSSRAAQQITGSA